MVYGEGAQIIIAPFITSTLNFYSIEKIVDTFAWSGRD